MTPEQRARQAAIAVAERQAQGLPARAEDPTALARIVSALAVH